MPGLDGAAVVDPTGDAVSAPGDRLGLIAIKLRRPKEGEEEGEIAVLIADPAAPVPASAILSPRDALLVARDLLEATRCGTSEGAFVALTREVFGVFGEGIDEA